MTLPTKFTFEISSLGVDATCEGHIASKLTRDEALGVLAEWLYGSQMPRYMKTLLEEAQWVEKHSPHNLTVDQYELLRGSTP